ncbi:MAG: isoprenylcysteine carboxylmethyltransferase family protein [Bacteroidota bacterium]|jgi:protein-S-isoprenylcysteine O-methyltransferase Ste14
MSTAKVLAWFKEHKSLLVNIYIALNLLIFAAGSIYFSLRGKTLDYNIIAYTIQSSILIFYIIIRKPHKRIDGNYLHQFIALAAFYSGLLFIWQPRTGGESVQIVSNIIIFTANVLAIVTIFNLGRSFGIMIALREVKTGGLYSIVRHPMYGTDILLRIGFLVSHFSPLTVVLMIVSILFYIYRAILEERYLGEQEEYRAYMRKVRYRFIPYVI